MRRSSKLEKRDNTKIRFLLVIIATVIVLVNTYWISSTWNAMDDDRNLENIRRRLQQMDTGYVLLVI